MFELLLERGAEPFDIQVLYDTHFSGDMLWWLELVYRHTIDTPRGAAWKDPEWSMLDMGGYGSGARFILEMAIRHRDMRLAGCALERGASPNAAPARDKRWMKRTLYELAVLDGLPDMAELFVRHGAERKAPTLDQREQCFEACLRLDRERAAAALRAHPEFLQSPRPMFEAAKRDRPDVLALLLELGFPLEAQDKTGKRALHEAAYANAVRAAQFLIDRGAEIDPRESTHGGAPISWASHGDRQEAMDLLSRHSRYIWRLCFRGYVERVREILRESSELARQVNDEGMTPLWWLPDDDEKAMQIVELLLAAGADAALKSADGRTAADWARRRGMVNIAKRLDTIPVRL
ncbi:MAG TPA: ankyrin repeat domain-containing protein [Vicinamibacterales bacterium]|jgi:ankyrin repeat protein